MISGVLKRNVGNKWDNVIMVLCMMYSPYTLESWTSKIFQSYCIVYFSCALPVKNSQLRHSYIYFRPLLRVTIAQNFLPYFWKKYFHFKCLKMKYVYRVNTNVKFDHKIYSKNQVYNPDLKLISSGHYRAPFLERPTFRTARF